MAKKKKGYKSTSEYKSWLLIVKGADKFPTDKYFNEVVQAHGSRKSRMLSLKSVHATKVIKASAEDVNLRSRCVELMTKAKRMQYSVSVANEAFKDYLISQGLVEGRTQADRNRAAASYIKKGVEVEADLDSFIDVMTDFIDDMDQTGWSLKRMMDGLLMASKPETSILEYLYVR